MAELAEAASVSLVTPYNYFGSKAGLLFGLLDMEHARDEAGTRLTSQDRDGLELTRDFGESRVRFYLEDAALFRPVFDGIFAAVMKLVEWILLLAPIGVLALVAWTVARIGLVNLTGPLLSYIVTVLLGLLLHGAWVSLCRCT